MSEPTEALSDSLRGARAAGVAWLKARICPDGAPAGANERAGWCRVPWTLALSGELDAATAVLAWAQRHAIDTDGGLREGPSRGDGTMLAYPLAHLAIGAWLLERYDLATALMDKLRTLRHPDTGGIDTGLKGPSGRAIQDLLMTAQVGIAALVTGQADLIADADHWVRTLYRDQPELPDRMFTMCEGTHLLTEPPAPIAWLGVVDFRLPRQAFYAPGIAAALMGGVCLRRRDTTARDLGRAFLSLNIGGTDAQFTDESSVQICKFGWGAATMLQADPEGGHLPHVQRMARWFVARQDSDGGWSPSRFFPKPATEIDRMIKTAEHVMEINTLLAALGTARGRG